MLIRGVDGCKDGWLEITSGPEGDFRSARVLRTVGEMFTPDVGIVAIDIPIGLPSRDERPCDRLARRRLPVGRKSSVFPAPVRAVLNCADHVRANAESIRVAGRGLSKQSFHLLPRIRQVDDHLRDMPATRDRAFEVHPEVSFAQWNGGRAPAFGKATGFGFQERLELTQSCFPGTARRIRDQFPGRAVADDDILDALAALWTAMRLEKGQAQPLDLDRPRDETGLEMNIWV
jgi:predicted RNase H-like nuclease